MFGTRGTDRNIVVVTRGTDQTIVVVSVVSVVSTRGMVVTLTVRGGRLGPTVQRV